MATSSASSTTSAVSAANSIGIEQFLRILSSQLNNQDPLQPLDNQQFLSQIAQFSSLQQTQEINTRIGQLLGNQGVAIQAGILGKTVTVSVTGANNQPLSVSGTVSEVTFPANGTPTFTLNLGSSGSASNLSFSQITSIR